MFASFHSEGIIPSSSDNLNTFVVSHQLQVIYYLSSSYFSLLSVQELQITTLNDLIYQMLFWIF